MDLDQIFMNIVTGLLSREPALSDSRCQLLEEHRDADFLVFSF